jgi:hypothetical protein
MADGRDGLGAGSISATIRTMGARRARYPHARRLLITAGGGSNGARTRLWTWEVQRLADETGLEIAVCHYSRGVVPWSREA